MRNNVQIAISLLVFALLSLLICSAARSEEPATATHQSVPQSTDVYFHVYFAEPSEFERTERLSEKLKTWTSDEKILADVALKKIGSEVPGLFKLLSSNGKMPLVRVSRFDDRSTIAVAKFNKILLSDKVFVDEEQILHTLLHEFIHAADAGYRISCSREWVDFAQPTIHKIRRASSYCLTRRVCESMIPRDCLA